MVSAEWNGLAWDNGELLRTDVRYYGDDYDPGIWMSDNLRDDIEDLDDIEHVLFFEDKEHFAAWVLGQADAILPEDIWNGNIA